MNSNYLNAGFLFDQLTIDDACGKLLKQTNMVTALKSQWYQFMKIISIYIYIFPICNA